MPGRRQTAIERMRDPWRSDSTPRKGASSATIPIESETSQAKRLLPGTACPRIETPAAPPATVPA